MSNIVQWGAYSIEACEEDNAEIAKGGSVFLKLKAGSNRVRPLPVLLDQATGKCRKLMVITYEHYIEVPGSSTGITAKCPRLMAKKPCPVCDLVDQLATNGNPIDAARAKKFAARKRGYMNVIDRSDPESGPKILAMGKQIMEQVTAIRKDVDAGGDFTDPESGFDLVISRNTSPDGQISYKVLPTRNSNPLGDEEFIAQQKDLSVYAVPDSAEEILGRLEGVHAALGLGVGDAQTTRRPRLPPSPQSGPRVASLQPVQNRQVVRAPVAPVPKKARTAADDVMGDSEYIDPADDASE